MMTSVVRELKRSASTGATAFAAVEDRRPRPFAAVEDRRPRPTAAQPNHLKFSHILMPLLARGLPT